MRIKIIAIAALMTLYTVSAFATDDTAAMHMDEHGGQIFHAFRLETDIGSGQDNTISTWDFRGWVGGDINKLWLRSEGTVADSNTEQAEFWALYSRNIATFWDMQVGVRQDTEPRSTSYLVAGFNGLAPYFFDTEAHVFVSDRGDASVRIREENDFLITQQLILQPYAEINLFAQDVPELDRGRGLATGEIGLQARYEINRKFAPYADVRYERKFGETASIAKKSGEDSDDFIASIGLRLMF